MPSEFGARLVMFRYVKRRMSKEDLLVETKGEDNRPSQYSDSAYFLYFFQYLNAVSHLLHFYVADGVRV